MKYRHEDQVSDAHQWDPEQPSEEYPQWLRSAMHPCCSAITHKAWRNGQSLHVDDGGFKCAKPNDWILRDEYGRLGVCPHDEFGTMFQPEVEVTP